MLYSIRAKLITRQVFLQPIYSINGKSRKILNEDKLRGLYVKLLQWRQKTKNFKTHESIRQALCNISVELYEVYRALPKICIKKYKGITMPEKLKQNIKKLKRRVFLKISSYMLRISQSLNYISYKIRQNTIETIPRDFSNYTFNVN